MSDLQSRLLIALERWMEALGGNFVLKHATTIQAWETATFETSQRVFAVLRPANTEEVANCVSIAHEHRIPIYPVSRGRNWGLGSRVPPSDAVTLDLSRLDRIVALDERFGCLTIEPGVTFAQVHAFLEEKRSDWFLPVIGGPPDASVLANCLERGDVSGPVSESAASLCDLQVVLPGGDVVHTGYERFGPSALCSLSSNPAGPSIIGIFTQSNLGVVTCATVWLTRRPVCFQLASAVILNGGLASFVDALQALQLQMGAQASISLWNGYKIQARGQSSATSPPPHTWYCSAALYAPSLLMASAQRELVLQALAPCAAELHVLDETAVPDLRQQAGIYLGTPSHDNLRSLYAANTAPPPPGSADPDRDRCGVLWLCPEIPLEGATIADAVSQSERTLASRGYHPVLGMQIHSARTARMFVSILYDRDVSGADARAMRCHDELLAAFHRNGWFPFRLGIQSMQVMQKAAKSYAEMMGTIKRALDPHGILAPGHYLPSDSQDDAHPPEAVD